jgi:hypothetical protein
MHDIFGQLMTDLYTPRPRSVLLVVLCILTIIGNLFLIIKGLVTYYVLDNSSEDRREWAIVMIDVFFLLEFLSCIGSIAGAILMIAGKRMGLIVYQFSSVIYILITALLAVFSILSIAGIPLAFLQILYLIPSIVFFILYTAHAKYLS